MFIRLLFVLLLTLNLGAAAWLLFGPSGQAPQPPPTDPGVAELRLLSETPGAVGTARPAPSGSSANAAGASTAARPATAAPASSAASAASTVGAASAASVAGAPQASAAGVAQDQCETLGPFQTQTDMRAAMQALSPHVPRIQYRQEQVDQLHGYWVYLAATATREDALAAARELSAKGVRDYYVVTAGDQQNTISLGLFHNPENARRQLDRIKSLGFNPKMKERVESQPAFWVDYALPKQGGFDWKTWLPGRSDLQAGPVDCF
jgi:SPOR domain